MGKLRVAHITLITSITHITSITLIAAKRWNVTSKRCNLLGEVGISRT